MGETTLQDFLFKLNKNYQVLQEREAKYANAAPLDLLNQIEDYEQAIALTEQAMRDGDVSLETLQAEFSGLNLELVDTVVFVSREKIRRKPFSGSNPYRGLRKFTEAEAELFFGRAAAIEQLLEMVNILVDAETSREMPDMVAVLGPSGSGKSSLVRAGLIPALRQGKLPGSERWLIKVMAPGSHPLDELAAQLVEPTGRGIVELRADLNKGERALHQLMLESLTLADDAKENPGRSQNGGTTNVASEWDFSELIRDATGRQREDDSIFVLVVDQFEELFTMGEDQVERQTFLDQLYYISQTRGNRGFVIITMRADFYGKAANYKRLADIITRNQMLVSPMTERELREAILLPAEAVGLELEKALVVSLLKDTTDAPGVLPLLQYTLVELFERRDGNLLTLEAYQEIGGVKGALAHRANNLMNSLAEEQQQIVRRIFLRLVQPGEGIQDTRRRAAFEEVLTQTSQTTEVESIVQMLVEANLLIADRDPNTDRVILDVSHEVLIQEWPQLRRWLNKDPRGFQIRQQLSQAVRVWESRGRDEDSLYRGGKLVEVEEWIAENPGEINQAEVDFIAAGQAARARARRRTQLVIAGLTVGLIVAIVGGLFGWYQQGIAETQTKVALARLLGAQALVGQETQPQRSILLALEAFKGPDAASSAAEEVLRQVLGATGGIGLTGDQGLIRAMAFSPNDLLGKNMNWLATGGEDNTVRLWDLGRLEAEPVELKGHKGTIRTVTFSPDGHWLASGGDDNTIRLWNVNQPETEPVKLEGHKNRVWSVVFSPDGRWLASGSNDKTVRLWDWNRPEPEVIILEGHEAQVNTVLFSPDGRWLASRSREEAVIRLWNMDDLERGAIPLQGHTERVNSIAFSPDGRWLVSGSHDDTVRLWDLDQPEVEPVVLDGHKNRVWSAAFSPDGRWLATGSSDKTVRLWDMSHLEQGARVLHGHQDTIWFVAFSPATPQYPQGRWLATVSGDNTVRLWDLSQPDPEPLIWRGHESPIWEAVFSPDGRWLVTRSNDRTVAARLWDVSQFENEPVVLREHTGHVNGVAFSPASAQSQDDQWLATGSSDRTVRLWNLNRPGVKPVVLEGHKDNINAVAFSPALPDETGGPWLATASDDGWVGLWNLSQSQPEPLFLEGHEGLVRAVAFSPDGRWVASGSTDKTARLWDVNQPEVEPVTLKGHKDRVMGVAFRPALPDETSGPWLATASDDGRVGLWDLSQSQPEPLFLEGHKDNALTVAFSPDGHWLASGSRDDTVRLWDVSQPDQIKLRWTLTEHKANIWAVTFSSDGRWLATVGDDNAARLWEMGQQNDQPRLMKTLYGHGGSIWAAAFSPDGYWLATGSADETARLWRTQLNEVIPIACRMAGRNLSVEEWEQFIGPLQSYHLTCPDLSIHPTVIEAARNLARAGEVKEAVKQFDHLIALDATLDIDPEAEAKKIIQETVQSLLDEGKELARAGEIEQATAKFKEAKQLNPDLDLDPTTEAQRLAQHTVENLVEEGIELAEKGDLEAALAKFKETETLDTAFEIPAEAWHAVCMAGSAHSQADIALAACDQAVELAPENGLFRNSRGLARALTGDESGAAEDFKFFTEWVEKNQ